YDDNARRCAIEGRGIDARGASRASASGIVTASGTETTLLKVEGNFTVTGPLQTFANAGGVHLARALLAEFAENMAREVERRAPAAAPEATPRAAAQLSAATMLWRAFLGWLRHILVRKGQGVSR